MSISQQIGAARLIQPGVIDNTAARPTSPFEGQCIFQKDTDQLLVWNGTAWVIPNQTTQNPEGLELVKTQVVGSGVTSVPVTAAFSSTYDSYMITWTGGVCNTSAEVIRLQLTGATEANYSTNLLYSLAATPNTPLAAGGTFSYFIYAGGGNSTYGLMSVQLHNPFLATPTLMTGSTYNTDTAFGHVVGKHSLSTSYTGFTVAPETSTITGGTIRVYGYRK